ncbi:hypothetical protein K525DRAFT_361264 [Schizophyllum commune Loenen D]|nr:hypothetical protein K525DRAFT_361264 [Schizophyllum commune Loenen D]
MVFPMALRLLPGALILTSAAFAYDPCAEIAGKSWVLPSQARACLRSFPADPVVKANVLEVVNKTLAFHTSTNYQIQAPEPFADQVQEDLVRDLARIGAQEYASEFDFHLDVYRTFKLVNDGHCGVYNLCYDSLYVTYLPTPLVVVDGQDVHIAPEAFDVASAEFGEDISFWQEALPGDLKGKLHKLPGAKVLAINGDNPWAAVNANAAVAGGYQGFATRQNGFFASYRASAEWDYTMGNFAQLTHPLVDSVDLIVQLVNETQSIALTLPYRSRFSSAAVNFTDSASYRANNCFATNHTNGRDVYETDLVKAEDYVPASLARVQQQPALTARDRRRHAVNVIMDDAPYADVALPEGMRPTVPALNESYSVAQFYMLNNSRTGVLALGSFSAPNFTVFQGSLLNGLVALKARGATNLIVDVVRGYICIAHWLHRIIVGPKPTSEPQAGLDTTTRAGPLAQLIVRRIAEGADPEEQLLYNPAQWRNATHQPFPVESDWLEPAKVVINGHEDAFSQRMGQECQPFDMEPPAEALFEPENVVIMSNGRCASSCSLFSITMAKEEGVRTLVYGGRADTPQQYCGVVGGQSTDFSTIDSEIKSVKLKNHTLAPPDFLTNSIQGITWRLGYGIDDPKQPEEWQDHSAAINLPVSYDLINKPEQLWTHVAEVGFPAKRLSFVAQQSF